MVRRGTDTAMLTVTINGANDAPVGATNDISACATTATEKGGTDNGAGGSNATGNVITNDTDVDNASSDVSASAPAEAKARARRAHSAASRRRVRHADAQCATAPTATSSTTPTARCRRSTAGGTSTDTFNYTVSDGRPHRHGRVISINGANDAPVANNDAGSATEKGGTNNGSGGSNATGNVITTGPGADINVDNTTGSLAVSAIRTGTEAGTGSSGTVGAGLTGQYGTLTMNPDGSYTYVVDNNNATVQALNPGGTLTDTFTYTVKDPGNLADTAELVITINGANDAPTVANLNGDSVTFTEGGAAVAVDLAGNGTVTNVEFGEVHTGTLTVAITAGGTPAEDVLSIGIVGGITTGAGTVSFSGTQIATFTGGTGGANLVITLDPDATQAATQALVRALQYSNSNNKNPSAAARTVAVTLTDGDGGTRTSAM